MHYCILDTTSYKKKTFFPATPGPPYALTVQDVTKRHVELKWEAPKNDGGRPIQRLVIRKKHICECIFH